jgi:hypothetical protein
MISKTTKTEFRLGRLVIRVAYYIKRLKNTLRILFNFIRSSDNDAL